MPLSTEDPAAATETSSPFLDDLTGGVGGGDGDGEGFHATAEAEAEAALSASSEEDDDEEEEEDDEDGEAAANTARAEEAVAREKELRVLAMSVRMFVPGTILHLYYRCGATLASQHAPTEALTAEKESAERGSTSKSRRRRRSSSIGRKRSRRQSSSASTRLHPASLKPPSFLARVEPMVHMGDDHLLLSYLNALRSARQTVKVGLAKPHQDLLPLHSACQQHHTGRGGKEGQPTGAGGEGGAGRTAFVVWKSFGAAAQGCACCGHDFTWESTSSSSAQRLMDMHHCRRCGAVVCDKCSKRKRPLPHLGMPFAERVCDRCFFAR